MKIKFTLVFIVCLIVGLTACNGAAQAGAPDASASSDDASAQEDSDAGYKLGFMIPSTSQEWYSNTKKGAQITADELGLKLVAPECSGDQDTQTAKGEALLAQKVDGLIIAPLSGRGVMPLINKAREQEVAVITHAVVADWQDIYIGTSDWAAGVELGVNAGKYALDNELEPPICLLVGSPAVPAFFDRTEGYKVGMLSIIPEAKFIDIDGGGNKNITVPVAGEALKEHSDINNIVGINEDSALGAMQVYEELGRDMSNLIVWGFGCGSKAAKDEMMDPDSPYKGSLALFPELYGRMSVLTARDILDGINPPEQWLMLPVITITADNLLDFYVKEGDNWNIIWSNVEALGYEYRPLSEALN